MCESGRCRCRNRPRFPALQVRQHGEKRAHLIVRHVDACRAVPVVEYLRAVLRPGSPWRGAEAACSCTRLMFFSMGGLQLGGWDGTVQIVHELATAIIEIATTLQHTVIANATTFCNTCAGSPAAERIAHNGRRKPSASWAVLLARARAPGRTYRGGAGRRGVAAARLVRDVLWALKAPPGTSCEHDWPNTWCCALHLTRWRTGSRKPA